MPTGEVSLRVKSAKVSDRTGPSPLQHDVSEGSQIFGGGKQAGMTGHATQHAGVFVLYFALDNAVAEAAVISGGRNGIAPRCRWIVGGVGHSQRAEQFALAEAVKSLISDAFESDAENNEADVAVFSFRSRIRREWSVESGGEQFGFSLLPSEIAFRRQANRRSVPATCAR